MKFYQCQECGKSLVPEVSHCQHCGKPASYPIPTDLRCECGFLLSKFLEDAIEIKCRRCKRLVYIPIKGLETRFEEKQRDIREGRVTFHNHPSGDIRGQYCSRCGQVKPNVVYGKCLDCRTESIKVQYKGRNRN